MKCIDAFYIVRALLGELGNLLLIVLLEFFLAAARIHKHRLLAAMGIILIADLGVFEQRLELAHRELSSHRVAVVSGLAYELKH